MNVPIFDQQLLLSTHLNLYYIWVLKKQLLLTLSDVSHRLGGGGAGTGSAGLGRKEDHKLWSCSRLVVRIRDHLHLLSSSRSHPKPPREDERKTFVPKSFHGWNEESLLFASFAPWHAITLSLFLSYECQNWEETSLLHFRTKIRKQSLILFSCHEPSGLWSIRLLPPPWSIDQSKSIALLENLISSYPIGQRVFTVINFNQRSPPLRFWMSGRSIQRAALANIKASVAIFKDNQSMHLSAKYGFERKRNIALNSRRTVWYQGSDALVMHGNHGILPQLTSSAPQLLPPLSSEWREHIFMTFFF